MPVSSSVRTSPRIAPVPLSVPACPPISADISARSALPCTLGSSTRLLVVSLSGSQSVLSILLSYHFPFFCFSFFVECSSCQGRVFFRCSVRATSVSPSSFYVDCLGCYPTHARLISEPFPFALRSHRVRPRNIPIKTADLSQNPLQR